MVRKTILIFMAIIFSSLVAYAIFFTNNDKVRDEEILIGEQTNASSDPSNQAIQQVSRSSVNKVVDMKGIVTYIDRNFTHTYVVPSNSKLLVNDGDVIKKNSPLYAINGKRIDSQYGGKINIGEADGSTRKIVIVELGKLRIKGLVPQGKCDDLRVGQLVKITYNQQEFTGTTQFIDYKFYTDNGVLVSVAYQDKNMTMRPGSLVKVSIITATKQNVLNISKKAIIHASDDTYHVQVMEQDNNLKQNVVDVPVQIGFIGDTEVEIVSGLEEGQQVIIQDENYFDNDTDLDQSDDVMTDLKTLYDTPADQGDRQ